jgi:hypothetical protein
MTINGPIVPKFFDPPTSDAVTPTPGDPAIGSIIAGEIITCTKTGRMWVNYRNSEMIPVRPEWTFENLNGDTYAGLRSILLGTSPFQSVGVEIYGSGLVVPGALNVSGTVTNSGAYSQNGAGAFNVNTSSPITLVSTSASAANTPYIQGKKPTLNNQNSGGTGDSYELAVNQGNGIEFGDYATGGYTLNAIIRKNEAIFYDPVKIDTVPNAGMLGTGANGQIGYAAPPRVEVILDPTFSLTTTGSWEDITDGIPDPIQVIVGVTGRTTIVQLNALITVQHTTGNADVSFRIYNVTDSAVVVATSQNVNGYGSLSISKMVQITNQKTYKIQINSTHAVDVLRKDATNSTAASYLEGLTIG